jgi:hypothetical protein
MSLLSIQRTMARAVMQPLTRSERMSGVAPNGEAMSKYAARIIKPNDRLTSFERLEIYNRQYWFRLIAGLTEDFPGLQAILGNRRFEQLSNAYLTECPSRSFTLRNLGRRLEGWLKKNPRWAGSRQGMALDMIRLEWADIEAFDGQAEPPLKTEDFAAADSGGANLRLRLQPYVQLLSLRYPVDTLVLKIKGLNDDTEFSSNAFRERRKRKHVQAIARLKPAQIFLAVHRVDYSVYFRRLDVHEYRLLAAIQQGKTLGQALHASFAKTDRSSQPSPEQITAWFQNWASLGWFCAAAKKPRRR